MNVFTIECCSKHILKCFLHLPFTFTVNVYVTYLFLSWGINSLCLRTMSLMVKEKKCVSCPERAMSVKEEGIEWFSLFARNWRLLLSIFLLFNICHFYKMEGQLVNFLWIMAVLLCCMMSMLLVKRHRWTLQISFFYFTFLWTFGHTIRSRVKESFTLVTSTGIFGEKHSQLSFVTELTQSGTPVWIQTDGYWSSV